MKPKTQETYERQKPRTAHVEEIEIREARGKTVRSMTSEIDPGYRCTSVEFEDDTMVAVNVDPAIQFQVQKLRVVGGDIEVLKNYRPILAMED